MKVHKSMRLIGWWYDAIACDWNGNAWVRRTRSWSKVTCRNCLRSKPRKK